MRRAFDGLLAGALACLAIALVCAPLPRWTIPERAAPLEDLEAPSPEAAFVPSAWQADRDANGRLIYADSSDVVVDFAAAGTDAGVAIGLPAGCNVCGVEWRPRPGLLGTPAGVRVPQAHRLAMRLRGERGGETVFLRVSLGLQLSTLYAGPIDLTTEWTEHQVDLGNEPDLVVASFGVVRFAPEGAVGIRFHACEMEIQ